MVTISHIACNAVEKLNRVGYNDANLTAYKIDPSAHISEIAGEKRLPRKTYDSSDFDKGYEEFLRNYHDENNIGKHGHYRVDESDENASYEHDDASNDDESGNESGEAAAAYEADYDSESESKSDESNEKRKNYRANPQSKSHGKSGTKSKNSKSKSKPADHKKLKKKCKTEKRHGMLCTICYKPVTDEKSESCSYSNEPKEGNYAYKQDSSYGGGKSKDVESFESEESNENYSHEPQRKNPPTNKYPVYRKQKQADNYYQPARPYANPNNGPQTFVPQPFRITHSRGRPAARYQAKKPAPNVALIRYRAAKNPLTSERIRLITYPPTAPQNRPNQSPFQNKRLSPILPDIRPPRDVNGAQTEDLLSSVTKEHEFEYIPSHSDDDATDDDSVSFKDKDGLNCRKFIDGKKICLECNVDGERRKECMFSKTNRPTRFFESYSTSKKSKHALGSHPIEFDSTLAPKSKDSHQLKPHSTKQNKKDKTQARGKYVKIDDQSNFYPITKDTVYEKLEVSPVDTVVEWKLKQNDKDKQTKSQQYRSIPEIIYGTQQFD